MSTDLTPEEEAAEFEALRQQVEATQWMDPVGSAFAMQIFAFYGMEIVNNTYAVLPLENVAGLHMDSVVINLRALWSAARRYDGRCSTTGIVRDKTALSWLSFSHLAGMRRTSNFLYPTLMESVEKMAPGDRPTVGGDLRHCIAGEL